MVLLYSTLYFSPKIKETDERHFLVRIRTFEKCVEVVTVVFVCVLQHEESIDKRVKIERPGTNRRLELALTEMAGNPVAIH